MLASLGLRQTRTSVPADLMLFSDRLLPNRMVNDLIEEHVSDWDVYLPAKVFSLCFKEHSQTKERPFSALCCAGLEPAQGPRGLEVGPFPRFGWSVCAGNDVCDALSTVHLFQGPGERDCH